jgi:hypothetical protein
MFRRAQEFTVTEGLLRHDKLVTHLRRIGG